MGNIHMDDNGFIHLVKKKDWDFRNHCFRNESILKFLYNSLILGTGSDTSGDNSSGFDGAYRKSLSEVSRIILRFDFLDRTGRETIVLTPVIQSSSNLTHHVNNMLSSYMRRCKTPASGYLGECTKDIHLYAVYIIKGSEEVRFFDGTFDTFSAVFGIPISRKTNRAYVWLTKNGYNNRGGK